MPGSTPGASRRGPRTTGGGTRWIFDCRSWSGIWRCDALRPIAERHGTTVAASAIAWVLAWKGVMGAIVGARSPEQIEGWIGAANLRLTDADLEEIAAAIERNRGGRGSGAAGGLIRA